MQSGPVLQEWRRGGVWNGKRPGKTHHCQVVESGLDLGVSDPREDLGHKNDTAL